VAILTPSLTEHKPRNLGTTFIAIGVVIALLYYGRDFFVTLITAVTIGFLLDPFVEMLMKLRLPRSMASFVVCALALLLLYLGGLGLYLQTSGLLEELPVYSVRFNEIVDLGVAQVEGAEQTLISLLPRRFRPTPTTPAEPAAPPAAPARGGRPVEPAMPPAVVAPQIQEVRIRETTGPLLAYISDNWEGVAHWLLMASFVPFLAYFTLSWRDHMRRSYLHLFHGAGRHAAGRSWQEIGDVARAYVVGNFVLGLFLTVASGVFFWRVEIPYFPLVAPISGFLSLVPYVGLPLAIIPPVLAALPVYNQLAPYIMIASVVGFLHLLALNLLYPKLVGPRVHLNPIAVTVGLMFWGILWGPLGLIFAIPITAGIKAVLDNIPGMQAYGRLLGD
jgi:predicted PurR-regulated permease PerM